MTHNRTSAWMIELAGALLIAACTAPPLAAPTAPNAERRDPATQQALATQIVGVAATQVSQTRLVAVSTPEVVRVIIDDVAQIEAEARQSNPDFQYVAGPGVPFLVIFRGQWTLSGPADADGNVTPSLLEGCTTIVSHYDTTTPYGSGLVVSTRPECPQDLED